MLIVDYILAIVGAIFMILGMVAIVKTIDLPSNPAFSVLFWSGLVMLIFGIRGIRKKSKQG